MGFNVSQNLHQGKGLRYEVLISISTENIVFPICQYHSGHFTDIEIFNERLKRKIAYNEIVLCDKDYSGYQVINKLDCN